MNHLCVRNFEIFQHYKSRKGSHTPPLWIKFYTTLLQDYEFLSLPITAQRHLMMIWLLAARTNNTLPDNAEWIGQQIGAKAFSVKDLEVLKQAKFLTPCESRPHKPL